MRRFLIAVAAIATLGLGGSAIAGSLDNGVPAKSLHGSKGVANGSIGHLSLKNGIVSCQKLTFDLQNLVCRGGLAKGTAGANGTNGANGTDGKNGADGINGTNGTNGKDATCLSSVVLYTLVNQDETPDPCRGPRGYRGYKGDKGDKGDTGASAPGLLVTHVTGGDSSVCGNDWANDDYTRTLSFQPQADGSVNVVRTYQGTFETIAGVHGPSGPCGDEDAVQQGGVTGTFTGYDVVQVTGGNYTPEATCPANCTTSAMLAAFFPGADASSGVTNDAWDYHYNAGANGTWVNASTYHGGNSGNITG